MVYRNEKKEIIIIHNNMDKSQKGTIEQMSNTKENTFYDSIYRSCKQVALIDSGRNQYPWGPEEDSWETGHVLFLDLSAGYIGVFTV